MTLEECVDLALRQSQMPGVAEANRLIAEARHRQSLAAWWPQVNLRSFGNLRSNEPNFEFPGMSVQTPNMSFTSPAGSITTPPGSITIPAGVLGPFPVTLPIPPQTIPIPEQSIHVPGQRLGIGSMKINLLDRFTYGAGIEAKWLVADGGERKARRDRAACGIEAARQEQRKSDIALVADVHRYFYGAVLSRDLLALGNDVLARMEGTLELTESFYKGGSMKVSRMDYLSNKVTVEALRSMIQSLKTNYELACTALTFSLGFGMDSRVEPQSSALSYKPLDGKLDRWVKASYEFSPDWKSLQAGLKAAELAVTEARAGYAPKVALMGDLHAFGNGMEEGGLATDENLRAWTVGVGVELPLFRGFLTKNQVAEARAELQKLEHQKVLLEEGIAVEVKNAFVQLDDAQKREHFLQTAADTALENRDLRDRAYRAGMTEAEKIFEALIMDAMARSSLLKTRYDAIVARVGLNSLVGCGFSQWLSDHAGTSSSTREG